MAKTTTPGPSPRSSITVLDRPHRMLLPSPVEQDNTTLVDSVAEKNGDIHSHDATNKKELSPSVSPSNDTEEEIYVTWDGPDDPANPTNWSKSYRWIITIICSLLTINVTFASSAPTVAARSIATEFGTSAEVSYLITSCFLLGYVFGSLLSGPGSELVGRRKIFLIAMTCYTLFHLGQSLAQNMATMLVTRFLAGFFAVAPLTNCGGVIADIWTAEGRGPAISLFVASVFLGPVLGPVIGGFIVSSSLGWRWVFWVMMIFAGSCTIIMALTLPETYAPILLQQKAQRMRQLNAKNSGPIYAEHEMQDWSFRGVVNRTVFRPFIMLYKEPTLILVTIYISTVYGVLYALFEAFPIIFIEKRHFTTSHDGLIFIGVGIGTTLGAVINACFSARYPALMKKWRGFPPPENRLFGAMVAGPTLVVGAFWLGWTGEYPSVPWYVPAISTVLIGMSIILVFISFLSYLVDMYLMHSASAFAANTMIRSAVAAAFPLFTVQMFTKMGVNWACSLVGCIAIVLSPIPFLFYKYGARIRQRSTFAPCVDLRIAKLIAEEEEQQGQV